MPKQSPVPDELSKPFWDAANEGRLVVQRCTACNRNQFPPQNACADCGSADTLVWHEMRGRGKIQGYCVMHDCRIKLLQADQPFNIAVVEMEDDSAIQMFSHLPGTPVDQVPVGSTVQLEFHDTPTTGQKVPEWRVVS